MYTLKKVFILTSFFGILFMISCQTPHDTGPCSTQYCLNGGDCLDGNCMCPPGFSGEHCEIENQTSSSFDCIDGKCIEVSSNGTYTTKAACEANCGSGNDPTPGYVCQTGNCKWVSDGAEYQTLSECQSKCSSSQSEGNVIFKNNTYTPVIITFDGTTKTVQPGSKVGFTGVQYRKGAGSATTSGKTSLGHIVGEIVSWNNLSVTYGSTTAPPVIDLDVDPEYFFLKVKNIGKYFLSDLTVNFATASQTIDDIRIPPDGQIHNIGYYRAFSNTKIRATLEISGQLKSWWNGLHFFFTNKKNQWVGIVSD